MKLKRLSAIFLCLSIIFSCVAVGVVSAATEAVEITPVTYSTREDFMQNVNSGANTLQFAKPAGEWEGVYKFTLKDDANIIINYGFTEMRNYGWSTNYSMGLYSDMYLTNGVNLNTATLTNRVYYNYLTKGTYYLYFDNNYASDDTLVLNIGQISKSKEFMKLSYVKTNNDKTATLKIACNEGLSSVKVYTCNYGQNNSIGLLGASVEFDKKGQFKVNYSHYANCHTNILAYDTYGFSQIFYAQVLNKYTATITGVTNKQYTGKAVKQSGVTVNAGYDGASCKATYKNNKNVGTATVTFTGSGNTLGNVSKTFKINPANIKSASSKVKGSKATLTWSKSKGAKKYVVEKKVGSKWKKVTTTAKTTCKLTVAKGKTQVRVYGFATVNKKTYKSAIKKLTVTRK